MVMALIKHVLENHTYAYRPSCLGLLQLLNIFIDQHGAPLQVIHIGETSIDEETFNEYLAEMRDHYTADKVSILAPPSIAIT